MKRCLSILLPIAVAAFFLLPGCGSSEPLGSVSGRVTHKGAPVAEGTITFEGEEGGIAAGELHSEGSYELFSPQGGLKPGAYKVAITPPEVELPSDGNTSPSMGPKKVDNIPQKYRSGETSGLAATVKAGENTFDFDME